MRRRGLPCPHGAVLSQCKPCLAAKARAFRAKRPGYVPGCVMKRNSPEEAKAERLLNSAKARAECTLTRGWVLDRIKAGRCEVTGVEFVLDRRWHPLSPSLDRKDPKGGYTPENVQVVTWIYNRAKGNGTHEDVMALARALTRRTA